VPISSGCRNSSSNQSRFLLQSIKIHYMTGESTVYISISVVVHIWTSSSTLILYDKNGWGRDSNCSPLADHCILYWRWLRPMGEQLLIYTVQYSLQLYISMLFVQTPYSILSTDTSRCYTYTHIPVNKSIWGDFQLECFNKIHLT
jgi:hypothetical protein